ncbi:MAG: hypothetical protein ACI9VR_003291 [Cognaticolwellia sp.]
MAAELLAEDFVAFCARWPQIEISGSYEVVSLGKQRADVAIRFLPLGVAPSSELHGRKVGNAHLAVYGRGDCWIGRRGELLDRQWARKTPWPDLPIKGGVLDGDLQRRLCAAGMGMARIPCFFADGHLERRTEPEPGLDIWVLVHPDLRRNPRLRLFRDMVVDALRRQAGFNVGPSGGEARIDEDGVVWHGEGGGSGRMRCLDPYVAPGLFSHPLHHTKVLGVPASRRRIRRSTPFVDGRVLGQVASFQEHSATPPYEFPSFALMGDGASYSPGPSPVFQASGQRN